MEAGKGGKVCSLVNRARSCHRTGAAADSLRRCADRPHGVIRFQHRRKISSILIRNTLVPIAIRTTPGSCLAIEGVKSPKTRSPYEYHPPGNSTKVRTAVGRQICAAGPAGGVEART
jgi:hypothetical protein